MLCQKCGSRNASVHITKIYNNKKTELNLCRDCAEEYTGKSKDIPINFSFSPFGLDSLISGFFGMNPMVSENSHNIYPKPLQCTYCGTTLDEIGDTGRVGCAMCYNTFKENLLPMIKKVHGNTSHTGHKPEGQKESIENMEKEAEPPKTDPVQDEISHLKNDMQNAVKTEDYEKAASIRDRIKELEKKLSGGDK